MKKIIANLHKQQKELEKIIQKREDKVYEASERWQESEACEDYEYKTEEIQDRINELYTLIEELKEII